MSRCRCRMVQIDSWPGELPEEEGAAAQTVEQVAGHSSAEGIPGRWSPKLEWLWQTLAL